MTGWRKRQIGDLMNERIIFVFGSNLAGRHGAGAAKWALENKGAIYGQGVGMQGDSYGIPTKDENIETLSLDRIKIFVDYFLEFARNHTHMTFQLTPIGCGLAGYKPHQIGPMFKGVSWNVMVPPEFEEYINSTGTIIDPGPAFNQVQQDARNDLLDGTL